VSQYKTCPKTYPVFRLVGYDGRVPLIDLDAARDQLTPVADALLVGPRKAAVSTWNAYETNDPAAASAISTTTRAGMIHDFTVREVRRALQRDDVKAVAREMDSTLDFFTVAVGKELLVRYKLVAAGKPRNVATEVQQRLALQRYDEKTMQALALDGMPEPPTFLTCGYTLDADGQLGTVSVQCDYNNTILWRFVVWGDSGEGFGNFESLPVDPDLSPDATVVRSAKEGKKRPDAISEG
jgi:hypothetical protein